MGIQPDSSSFSPRSYLDIAGASQITPEQTAQGSGGGRRRNGYVGPLTGSAAKPAWIRKKTSGSRKERRANSVVGCDGEIIHRK